jgi:hypothetical protein
MGIEVLPWSTTLKLCAECKAIIIVVKALAKT